MIHAALCLLQVTEFAKQLRQAILSGQDVSSTWKPAAQALATRTQLSQTSQQQAEGLQPTEGGPLLLGALVDTAQLTPGCCLM